MASSGPPTTSQRYQRAPLSQPRSEGRNHDQLSRIRSARLSSTERNFSNAFSQVVKTNFP